MCKLLRNHLLPKPTIQPNIVMIKTESGESCSEHRCWIQEDFCWIHSRSGQHYRWQHELMHYFIFKLDLTLWSKSCPSVHHKVTARISFNLEIFLKKHSIGYHQLILFYSFERLINFHVQNQVNETKYILNWIWSLTFNNLNTKTFPLNFLIWKWYITR